MTREEYEKEHRRLCDVYYLHCEKCVLSKWCENSDTVKDFYSVINEAYDIVQEIEKWGKEHPIKTNRDKLEEVFGDVSIKIFNDEWLDEEYQEPKGE